MDSIVLGQNIGWTGQNSDFIVTSTTLHSILSHTSKETRTTLENQVKAMHKHVILKDHWRKYNLRHVGVHTIQGK